MNGSFMLKVQWTDPQMKHGWYSLCTGWAQSRTGWGCTEPCTWRDWRRWPESIGPLCKHKEKQVLSLLAFKEFYQDGALTLLIAPASSPDEQWYTTDVLSFGREGWSDWGLGFRQGDPDISSSQGPTVIGPIPTHAHPVAAAIKREHYLWLVSKIRYKFILSLCESVMALCHLSFPSTTLSCLWKTAAHAVHDFVYSNF